MVWQCKACCRQQKRAKVCVFCGGPFFSFKELQFIHNRVHGDNPRAAAVRAGFGPRYGEKLEALPEIRLEIDKRNEILWKERKRLEQERK